MNSLLKNLIYATSQVVPLKLHSKIYSKLVRRNRIAFCYHLVNDERLPHISNLYIYKTSQMFLDDLNYLIKNIQFVDLENFLKQSFNCSHKGKPVGIISFDDGLAQSYSVAKPILEKLNLPATFFLTVDFIDNRSMMYRHKVSLCIEQFKQSDENQKKIICERIKSKFGHSCSGVDTFCPFILSLHGNQTRIIDELCEALNVDVNGYLKKFTPYLTTEQIKELEDEGYDIGAHSLNHFDFNMLSFHEMEQQIVKSCEYIAEITGRSPVHFAVPFTLAGIDKGMLKRISFENSVVGTIFGTSGLFDEHPFVHRIWSDSPIGSSPGKSNLPSVLKNQYTSHVIGFLKRRFPF